MRRMASGEDKLPSRGGAPISITTIASILTDEMDSAVGARRNSAVTSPSQSRGTVLPVR